MSFLGGIEGLLKEVAEEWKDLLGTDLGLSAPKGKSPRLPTPQGGQGYLTAGTPGEVRLPTPATGKTKLQNNAPQNIQRLQTAQAGNVRLPDARNAGFRLGQQQQQGFRLGQQGNQGYQLTAGARPGFALPGTDPRTAMGAGMFAKWNQMNYQDQLALEAAEKAAKDGNSGTWSGEAGFGDLGRAANGDPSGARGLDGTRQWQTMIEKAAKEAGIPWQVVAAIMGIETGGVNQVNPASGATGLMQIMPNIWQGTANQFGGDLMDPWTNIRTAAEILKMNYQQYGNWGDAANAYLGWGPADAHGTTGDMYVNLFANNIAALGWSGGGQGVQVSGNGKAFPVQGYSGAVDLHWGEHPGAADIFADYGTPVLAIAGGTASSGYSDIGGYWTYIVGDDGLVYYYAHMDKMGPNGRVNAGDYIAGVSDTGNAKGTGAHLHLGIATAGHGIINGSGPSGGAGDINVIDFLNGTTRY